MFSALLYVHYLSPVDSGFCASGGGCEAVRASGFSYFMSRYLNIPLVGLLAYGSLFVASLAPAPSFARRFLHWPSALGGVVGLGLIVTQAVVLQAYCWMCLVVDSLAVGLAFISLWMVRTGAQQRPLLKNWSWATLGTMAIVLPLLWNWAKPLPPVPAEIRALYQPGKINVVEFADFQCPFCKRFHPVLKRAMEEYGDRVHFVRKHMPLVQHRFALHAAKGHVCAEQQGQGEAMADRLMELRLSQDIAFDSAGALGLQMDQFRECMKSELPAKRIAADQELLEKAGFRGLPTTYIGDRLLVGAKAEPTVKEALAAAASGPETGGVSGALYLAISTVVVLGLAFLGRDERSS